MTVSFSAREVEIVAFPGASVGVLRHRGDKAGLGATIENFVEWRKAVGVRPPRSATYNVFYGGQEAAEPGAFQLDLAAAVTGPVAPNPQGVVAASLPACRCARLRLVGGDDSLGEALVFLIRDWLPARGERRAALPVFCQRVRFFPDVAEHEAVTDIFVPLG